MGVGFTVNPDEFWFQESYFMPNPGIFGIETIQSVHRMTKIYVKEKWTNISKLMKKTSSNIIKYVREIVCQSFDIFNLK